MENDIYVQTFNALGIPVKPLPSNYSPEEFGRSLLSMSKYEHGVSYAVSTDYTSSLQKSSDTTEKKQFDKDKK